MKLRSPKKKKSRSNSGVTLYVINVGLQMLTMYGWPAFAYQTHGKCTLQQFTPLPTTGNEIKTTDETGADAFYSLGIDHPLIFNCQEAADYVIWRFKLSNAVAVPWRG